MYPRVLRGSVLFRKRIGDRAGREADASVAQRERERERGFLPARDVPRARFCGGASSGRRSCPLVAMITNSTRPVNRHCAPLGKLDGHAAGYTDASRNNVITRPDLRVGLQSSDIDRAVSGACVIAPFNPFRRPLGDITMPRRRANILDNATASRRRSLKIRDDATALRRACRRSLDAAPSSSAERSINCG